MTYLAHFPANDDIREFSSLLELSSFLRQNPGWEVKPLELQSTEIPLALTSEAPAALEEASATMELLGSLTVTHADGSMTLGDGSMTSGEVDLLGEARGPERQVNVNQAAAEPGLPPWKELTADEMARLLDERAQKFLGMSGEEFLAALEAGTLPDTAAVAHLATMAGAGLETEG